MNKFLLSSTLVAIALLSAVTGRAQSLCNDFGKNGLAATLESHITHFNSAIVLPNGKIVAVGYYDNNLEKDFLVARFNSDGTPDFTFGDGGVRVYDLTGNDKDDEALCVAVAPDGNLLVGGISNEYGTIIKIAGNGLLVASFGTNGQVRYPILYTSVEELLIRNNTIYGVGKTYASENIVVRHLRIHAYNTNGTPITAFGEDGMYVNRQFWLMYTERVDAAFQTDGKIVVSTRFPGVQRMEYWRVIRVNTDGTTDTSFGNDGEVEFEEPEGAGVRDIKLDNDGNIYLGGFIHLDSDLPSQAMVKKLNGNGALMGAFHGDGSAIHTGAGDNALINAIEVDANGKIYIAGSKRNASGEADFLLGAFNANGTIDINFGVHVDRIPDTSGGELEELIRLANGEFIACGYVNGADHKYGVVVKYTATGKLDATFGTNGSAVTRYAGEGSMNVMARTSDGKIVTAGTYSQAGSNTGIAVARFNADGSPDLTFGTYGYVRYDINENRQFARALHVYDDGKILIGGGAHNPGNGEDYLLVKLKADGSLDNTFGDNGIFTKHHGPYAKHNRLNSVRVDAQGRILIAGDANYTGGSYNDATMMRLLPNLDMDTNFGNNGVCNVQLSILHDTFSDVAIMTDGSYLLLGQSTENTSGVVVKVSPSGVVDETFGNSGIFTLPWPDTEEVVYPSRVLSVSNNKLLIIGGKKKKTQTGSIPVLYRINVSGSVDNSFNGNGYKILFNFMDGQQVGLYVDGENIVVGGERQTAISDVGLQILDKDGGDIGLYDFKVGEDNVVGLIKNPSGGYIAGITTSSGLGLLACLNPTGSTGGNNGDCSSMTKPQISTSDGMLVSTVGDSYQWYKDSKVIPGATNRQLPVDLLDEAIYKVKVTIGNCTLFSGDYFNIITAVSPEKARSISVYPNPVHGDITIKSTTDLRDVTLELFSPQGALLNSNSTATGFSTTLRGDGLAPGVYFLRAKSNHGTEIIRILKTR